MLAAGVREQPTTIVATHAPMPYFEGAFRAVFPGTTLVKGAAPARLCRTTKTFKGSGGQGKNFGIGPAAKDLTRRAYAFCNKKLAPPPPATKATIVHLARGGGAGINGRHLVNANASLATLLKVFPNASVVERTTHGGETHFCGQLMFDAATVVLTAHGSHVVAALFAPVNTIVLEVMPWDMWTGRGFSYGGANKYLAGTGVVFDRVRSVKPLHPSKAVQKSNFKRPTPSTRRCRHDCVCLMAWGGTSRNNFQMVISTQIKGRGAFSHDPVTIDLNHLAAVAARAKGRLAGAATRTALAAALPKAVARAALRRNPTCVTLDKSVREGKGKCKPGKGVFCNARHRCYGNSACKLCEP